MDNSVYVHPYAFVSYRRLSLQFQFSLSAVTLYNLPSVTQSIRKREEIRIWEIEKKKTEKDEPRIKNERE